MDELDRLHDDMMKCYKENKCEIGMTAKDEEAFTFATRCQVPHLSC